jgi:hypothetical protein
MLMTLQSGFDKALEQRMSIVRLRLKLRMILDCYKPWMRGQFYNFHEAAIRTGTSHLQTGICKFATILRIEFVAVPMTFADL